MSYSTWKLKLKYDIVEGSRKQYISSNFWQYILRKNVNQFFIPKVFLNFKDLLLFVCKLNQLDNLLTGFYFFWLSKKDFYAKIFVGEAWIVPLDIFFR